MTDEVETWPVEHEPTDSNFYLESRNTKFESPITGSVQILRRQGRRFRVSLALSPTYRSTGQRMDALLARLDGQSGTIRLWNFERPEPLGTNLDVSALPDTLFDDDLGFDDDTGFIEGTGVSVSGDHERGDTEIDTVGWLANQIGALIEGDFIGIGGWLYMMVADADSDAESAATLYIRPPLRADVEAGTEVIRLRPTSEFRLIDDQQPGRPVEGEIYRFKLEFVESLERAGDDE